MSVDFFDYLNLVTLFHVRLSFQERTAKRLMNTSDTDETDQPQNMGHEQVKTHE